MTVTPPPGYNSQTASVIVYNADGQNSTFYQSQPPPTYVYPAAGTPQVTVVPSTLPAGTLAMVDVTSTNMQFVPGQVTVGLGTFDVAVQRVWWLGANHVVANVAVASGAVQGSSDISVISGFQTAFQPLAFQTQPASSGQPAIGAVVNADSYQQSFYVGSYVTVYGSALAVTGVNPQVQLNGQPVTLLYASANQINFQVPGGIPNGVAILTISNGTANSLPFAMEIDNTPPAIVSITNALAQPVNATQSAGTGDILTVVVAGVDPSVVGSKGRVHVTVGGIDMAVQQVTAGAAPGIVQVVFPLTQSFGGAVVPLGVTIDSSHTDPVSIAVR
jgi:uncharacterized protein (TIGR03437 family)